MKKMFLLIVACSLVLAATAQETPKSENLTGTWVLDSLSIKKIIVGSAIDIPVKLDDVKVNIECIFDSIDFTLNGKCKIAIKRKKINASYFILGDLFFIQYNNINLAFHYNIDDNTVILKQDFKFEKPSSSEIGYFLLMRFKKFKIN